MTADAELVTIVKSCEGPRTDRRLQDGEWREERRCLWILGSCSGTAGGLAKAVCLLQCLALGGAFDVSDGMGLLLNGVSWSKGSDDP